MARFSSTTEERYQYFIIEEQYSINRPYLAPQAESQIVVFERLGQRADRKPNYYYNDHHEHRSTAVNNSGHKGPYLHASHVLAQQQQQQQEGRYLQNFGPRGPYLQNNITVACKTPYLPPVTIVQQVPAPTVMKKHPAPIMDCNEAAKNYGGILLTEYGSEAKKKSFSTLGY